MSDESSEKPHSERIPPPHDGATNPAGRRVGGIFVGCLIVVFLIWVVANLIFAIIGLITGYLYLPPARGGEAIELYGVWARVVSAIVLLFYGGIGFLIFRWKRRQRRPKVLGDYDRH